MEVLAEYDKFDEGMRERHLYDTQLPKNVSPRLRHLYDRVEAIKSYKPRTLDFSAISVDIQPEEKTFRRIEWNFEEQHPFDKPVIFSGNLPVMPISGSVSSDGDDYLTEDQMTTSDMFGEDQVIFPKLQQHIMTPKQQYMTPKQQYMTPKQPRDIQHILESIRKKANIISPEIAEQIEEDILAGTMDKSTASITDILEQSMQDYEPSTPPSVKDILDQSELKRQIRERVKRAGLGQPKVFTDQILVDISPEKEVRKVSPKKLVQEDPYLKDGQSSLTLENLKEKMRLRSQQGVPLQGLGAPTALETLKEKMRLRKEQQALPLGSKAESAHSVLNVDEISERMRQTEKHQPSGGIREQRGQRKEQQPPSTEPESNRKTRRQQGDDFDFGPHPSQFELSPLKKYSRPQIYSIPLSPDDEDLDAQQQPKLGSSTSDFEDLKVIVPKRAAPRLDIPITTPEINEEEMQAGAARLADIKKKFGERKGLKKTDLDNLEQNIMEAVDEIKSDLLDPQIFEYFSDAVHILDKSIEEIQKSEPMLKPPKIKHAIEEFDKVLDTIYNTCHLSNVQKLSPVEMEMLEFEEDSEDVELELKKWGSRMPAVVVREPTPSPRQKVQDHRATAKSMYLNNLIISCFLW
jgi:hypothetical protein